MAYRLKTIFTLVSAALSGLFGYLLAEGVMGLNVLLAALFAAFAFGLAWAVALRAFSIATGDRMMVHIMTVCAVPLLLLNTIADYSSAAAVRNIVATRIGDQNRVTNDKVGEVKRIEKRLAEIKSGWKTTYLSPDAYQAEIDNLQGDFLFKRSKGCTDTSLPDSRAHCAKIASAKAHKSMAEQRQKEDKEAYDLGIQLAAAKEASAGVVTHANATEAATRAFVSWALLTRNLSDDNTVWGMNTVMLITTIALMIVICGLSHYIGTIHGREHLAQTKGDEEPSYVAPRVEGPAAARAPIPLKEVHDSLVVVEGRAQPNSTEIDAMMAMAREALERYRSNNPFAKQEGRA